MFTSRSLVLAVLAASAASQSLTSGISTTCTNALTGVATNPDAAACLSPGSLISLVAGGDNTSIIPPINSWLASICGAPPCSNATLAAVVTNVTQGCSTELSSLGFSAGMTSSITTIVEQYYPTVRKVLCLKDGDTNCITQTLTNLQNVVGGLTLTNIIKTTSNPPTLPANITCTNCIKAAYNIINTDFPSAVSSAAPSIQSQCGASFTDGTTPAGILQSSTTSGTTSGKSSSGAVGATSMMSQAVISALSVSGLIIISTAFKLA